MPPGHSGLTRWSADLVGWSATLVLTLAACADQEPTAPTSQSKATRDNAQVQEPTIVPGKPATGKIRTDPPPAGYVAPVISPQTPVPLGTQFPPDVMEAMRQRVRSLPLPPSEGIGDGISRAQEPSAPSLFQSFLGHAENQPGNSLVVPDNGLAAGPNHLVTAVNFTLKIWNKGGGQLARFTLTDWFGASITVPNMFIFDPKIIFDAIQSRFVVVAVGTNDAQQQSRVYVAVSPSSSAIPTSNWCVFEFDLRSQGQSNQWLDFPSVGINNNAVIISANRIPFGGSFAVGSQVAWLEKATLYGCTTSTPLLRAVPNAFTLQVAQSYINNNITYLINSVLGSNGVGNTLSLWRTTSARFPFRATFTNQAQVPVQDFFQTIPADQPGPTQNIDTGDPRLLNAVLRTSGLWTAHTTACRPAGDNMNRTCPRFYQINPSTNRVVQWGQIFASGFYYYFPAAVPDGAGNMVMVFNRSGATEFASVRYSGRRASDPAGQMQPSAYLRAGRGCSLDLDNQTPARNRFGDYSALAWDAGTQSFWAMAEFVLGNTQNCSANAWGTQVGQIARP